MDEQALWYSMQHALLRRFFMSTALFSQKTFQYTKALNVKLKRTAMIFPHSVDDGGFSTRLGFCWLAHIVLWSFSRKTSLEGACSRSHTSKKFSKSSSGGKVCKQSFIRSQPLPMLCGLQKEVATQNIDSPPYIAIMFNNDILTVQIDSKTTRS